MKIVLINPRRINTVRSSEIKELQGQEGFYPPLGLQYLASYVAAHSDHACEVLDADVDHVSHESLAETVSKRFEPDVIGIHVSTFNMIDAALAAKQLKEAFPNATIVVGGPQISHYPVESLHYAGFDVGVVGEGEEAFFELVQALDRKQDIRGIAGLVYKDDAGVHLAPERKFLRELDKLPFPVRPGYQRYFTSLTQGTFFSTMLTSRGCPFRCTYCDQFGGRKYRIRSAENVLEELHELVERKITDISIIDDIFTIQRKRVLQLCKEIVRAGIHIRFKVSSRVDTIDEEVMAALAEAGCDRIHYGIESGNQRVLDRMKKDITLDEVRKAVGLTRKYGVKSYGYFMLGAPDEKRSEMLDTIEFARNLGLDYAQFSVTTPYPGTDLYHQMVADGEVSDFWLEYSKNPRPDFSPPLCTKQVSEQEIIDLVQYGYRRFYLQPRFILREIASLRSPVEFKRKAQAGFQMIVGTLFKKRGNQDKTKLGSPAGAGLVTSGR